MSSIWPNEFWIAMRTDGYTGSGAPSDPYDGSSPACFDNLMLSFPDNVTIHLGPGVFQTGGTSVWNPKNGWKLVGAGIDVTIIKLVLKPTTAVPGEYWAIGTGNYIDGFEASDFTVDCNLDG